MAVATQCRQPSIFGDLEPCWRLARPPADVHPHELLDERAGLCLHLRIPDGVGAEYRRPHLYLFEPPHGMENI